MVLEGLKRCGFREFQSGLKPCDVRVVLKPRGFRVVLEWSKAAWFQSGFRGI